MKLYSAHRAPYPRRVLMFMHEKGIQGVEIVELDLLAGEQKTVQHLARNPIGRVPALELDDGRTISEARAICTWLEGRHPEPNLMGVDAEERAFIEMHDRRVEWYWMAPIINWMRHLLPGLEGLDRQIPEFGHWQGELVREGARRLDAALEKTPWVAGERFTIADITAFCALEVARVMKFKPGNEGFMALQAWRDRMAARPSASVG